jgi:hypothetical protein
MGRPPLETYLKTANYNFILNTLELAWRCFSALRRAAACLQEQCMLRDAAYRGLHSFPVNQVPKSGREHLMRALSARKGAT